MQHLIKSIDYLSIDQLNIFFKVLTPIAEITDFKVLIDGKSFDVPISNKEDAYEKIIEISKNNNYTIENLLLDCE